eukprot:1365609-Amorphochlora_amoeboformis.AAC.3
MSGTYVAKPYRSFLPSEPSPCTRSDLEAFRFYMLCVSERGETKCLRERMMDARASTRWETARGERTKRRD